MAAVNLPDSPANGTTQTVGGITYTYNSSKGYWTAAASSGGGGGGGASVSTSDAAPSSPSDGDLWYDTDDGGMFVYYQDTDSSQWVEVIGSQGAAGPAGAAGATTAGVASVYATVNALPTSGNSQGDMAHVTANNTLYFWNGSGWYKIALINTNPSISGVASSYALAIDGTATTVTMTATDPEGLPITYSIASDTSGNIATVSQGTGASTNVFTITPSTNTAYAGSFTLTFRASDGVNVATAPATFTLQFKVQNSRYTSSLITSVGANNAVNNSFDDKSTNDHTITANGNVTQTTFSPYRHGGYSTKFVGTEYLKTNSSISLANDFTMEFWVYRTTSGNDYMVNVGNTNSTAGMQVYIGSSGGQFNFYHNGGSRIYSTSSIPALNEWSHIAVVRNSGTVTMYLNGTSIGTYSMTDTISGEVYVNAELYNSSVNSLGDGYMRDVRIVDGTAIYTSNFTPPTEKLTEVSGTEVLLCNLPYIVDSSSNNLALTITGSPETEPFAPYDRQEYSASSHLGSASFDGSGDYLSMANDTSLVLGTGEFTVECWIYMTSLSRTVFIDKYNGTASSWQLQYRDYNSVNHIAFSTQAGHYATTPSNEIKTNTWYHIAAVRDSSNNLKIYINGVEKGSSSGFTQDLSATSQLNIGVQTHSSAAGYMNGNIADVRIVKGTAVYTSAFTPPTAPLTAITNTELLVQSTDAGIIDKGQSARDLTLFGNTKSSTTQNKFLTSSMYFDGSGDYLKWTNTKAVDWGIGGEPFTLEWWQWWPSIVDSRSVGPQTGGTSAGWNSSSGHQWTMFTYSSSATLFMQWWNGSGRTDYELNHGGALTASTWQHFAIVYDGTNLSNYIDGTRIGHRTSGNTFGTVTNRFGVLGGNTAGTGQSEIYYSDVRITKGLARYSGTSLTVPTAALKG